MGPQNDSASRFAVHYHYGTVLGLPLRAGAPPAPPTVAPAPEVAFRPPYRVVAVAAADVRAAPVRSAPVVAALPRRTPLAVLGVAGTWAHVVTRAGRVGWIGLYLTVPL